MRVNAQSGFTLIELVMCLFILGLVSGTIMLTLPDSQPAVASEADRLTVRLSAAANHSILSGEVVGAALAESGYSFHRLIRGEWSQVVDAPLGAWQLAPESAVAISASNGVTELRSEANTDSLDQVRPNIVFYPVGLNTPFSILLTEGSNTIEISSRGAGEIEMVRADAD